MIGIVGPKDSVSLAQHIAEELGCAGELLGLAYKHVDEAVQLARSLEPTCEVLLFTGRVPYEQAKRSGNWRCELDVIEHSEADLYRMIGLVLKETGGVFPRVSVDSLSRELVRGVFKDMDLPVPKVVTPVTDEQGALTFEDAQRTAQSHLAVLAQGQAEAALTCLADTYKLLRATGVVTWRIDHARVTIADSLQRALLASEVRKTRGSSIAVAVITTTFERSIRSAKEVRATVDRAVTSYARRMGSGAAMEGERYTITTTQAAVEDMVDRHRAGQKSLIDLATNPPAGVKITLGVGVGDTFATALDSAEKALRMATSIGEPALVRENGRADSLIEDGRASVNLQETSRGILELAEQTGLGPLSLRRLVAALGRADHTGVTAQQLGEFYGVLPRSARRMLGMLVAAGFAREAGVRGAAGAGRPHVVYNVDLAALRRAMTTGRPE